MTGQEDIEITCQVVNGMQLNFSESYTNPMQNVFRSSMIQHLWQFFPYILKCLLISKQGYSNQQLMGGERL